MQQQQYQHIHQPEYPKLKKPARLEVKQPEISSKKAHELLRNKEWEATISKEIDQFEQTIHQVEALFKEADTSAHLVSLGNYKLVQNEYEYAAFKLQHLRELIKQFEQDRADFHAKKQKLRTLIKKEEKSANEQSEIEKLTKEQQNFKYNITKSRDTIELQFSIAERVLQLVQVYIQLREQYQNPHDLQKHRDYILSKIEKIKKSEDKHVKKLDRHYNKIIVDDGTEEVEVEDPLSADEEVEQVTERQELLKLCESLVAYLGRVEKKDENHIVQHDFTTYQFFDQIKVATPTYYRDIAGTLELIAARRAFYETAPESEFVKKEVKQEVKQQQDKPVDITNEKDFPKLS